MRHLVAWYGPDYVPPDMPPPKKPEREPPKPEPEKKPPPKKAFAHAIVIGRFDPLHRGHQMLIDTARGLADATTIVVNTAVGRVPGATRVAWCRELADAVALDAPPAPGGPHDLAFWQHWAAAIRPLVATADVLVSSDRQAWRLADVLGVAFVLVDPDRLALPIAATEIRRDPRAAWDLLAPPARAHYATRVTLLGPEASGKSTLARALADALRTVWVPEQARVVAERRRGVLRVADLERCADVQLALEDALARQANRVVVNDTDARSLELWAERLFGSTPAGLAARAAACRPDLYVLAEPLPLGTADPARARFARRCREVVTASGVPWVVAGGSIEQRVSAVLAALAQTASHPQQPPQA
jgi:NadR type nicotinamide-nucleotide adenylyltransferase